MIPVIPDKLVSIDVSISHSLLRQSFKPSKFYALNPMSIKTENILFEQTLIGNDEEITFEGINIKTDMIDFVKGLESVENKQKLINYLIETYDKCEGTKK